MQLGIWGGKQILYCTFPWTHHTSFNNLSFNNSVFNTPYLSRFSRLCEPTALSENLAAVILLCYSVIIKQMHHNKTSTGYYCYDFCVICHFQSRYGRLLGAKRSLVWLWGDGLADGRSERSSEKLKIKDSCPDFVLPGVASASGPDGRCSLLQKEARPHRSGQKPWKKKLRPGARHYPLPVIKTNTLRADGPDMHQPRRMRGFWNAAEPQEVRGCFYCCWWLLLFGPNSSLMAEGTPPDWLVAWNSSTH